MFSLDKIYREFCTIIESTALPIDVVGISRKIWYSVIIENGLYGMRLYSPDETYSTGDRVFHLAPKHQTYFKVDAVDNEKRSMEVYFSDNTTISLAQNDPSQSHLSFTPRENKKRILAMVEHWVNECPDVVEIAGLFVHKRLFDVIPYDRLSSPKVLFDWADMSKHKDDWEHIEALVNLCIYYDLDNLHYLTPIENVASILQRGILAKNLAPNGHVSFANQNIQNTRHAKRPWPNLECTVHDHVPLFFAPRPPLLYSMKESQSRIVYFLVDTEILLVPGSLISSANASSPQSSFYTDEHGLHELDWDVLHAHYWGDQDDEAKHAKNKLNRQAEALIPITVPLKHVSAIAVYDKSAYDVVSRELAARNCSIPVRIERQLYY